MKKMIISLLLVMLLFGFVNKSYALFAYYYKEAIKANKNKIEEGDFNIRKVFWGMNKDQVLANEWGLEDSKQQDAAITKDDIRTIMGWIPDRKYPYLKFNKEFDYKLTYIDYNISDEKMQLDYYFVNDRLMAAKYRLLNKPKSYIDKYKYFTTVLKYKYGEPEIKLAEWHCTIEIIPVTQSEGAVSQNWLSYNAMWHVKDTIIYARLHGGGLFDSYLDILYIYDKFTNKARIDDI